jgi:hypothetical protein
MEVVHSRQTYDYRIQEAICGSGDRELFPEMNIPRSTIRSWIQRGLPEVISCDFASYDHAEPHSAFQGQTPDEVFFGIGDEVAKKLNVAHKTARQKQMEESRTALCGVRVGETTSSGALPLQRLRFGMSRGAARLASSTG